MVVSGGGGAPWLAASSVSDGRWARARWQIRAWSCRTGWSRSFFMERGGLGWVGLGGKKEMKRYGEGRIAEGGRGRGEGERDEGRGEEGERASEKGKVGAGRGAGRKGRRWGGSARRI